MPKLILFLLVHIFFLSPTFSQKPASIELKSALVKKINFKNAVSVYDKNMYQACVAWKLSADDVEKIFSLVKPISSEAKGGLYNSLPCYYEAEVLYEGKNYTMEINAASFIVLYNENSIVYFGCPSKACSPFFILPGGNASGD